MKSLPTSSANLFEQNHTVSVAHSHTLNTHHCGFCTRNTQTHFTYLSSILVLTVKLKTGSTKVT